ncbi:MAG: cytochrome C biosynthesis protein [Bacteroidetes bacterium]|nr:MAG: cytochrome C biosynthesis protein [Bacteroidota bacterium]
MSKVKTNAELLNTTATTQKPFDTEGFIARYRNLFLIIVGAIAAGVLLYFAYNYYANQQEQEAQKDLFPAVYFAEADSMKLALKGTKNYRGLERIIKDYPNTKAGMQARFYAGVAYMKEGKFQKAIDELKQFNLGDQLVQARAYSLVGDAYVELNKLEDAVSYYNKAVNHQPNEFFTPAYMMKLGLVYELQKKSKDAIDIYNKVVLDYPTSNEATNAKKYKARLEAMQK